jgi:hypothetical protein
MAEQILIYQTQAVNFTDTSFGGSPPLSRVWSFTGGSITSATGATATVFYSNPGNYNVSLTITDINGTVKTETKNGLVKVDPGSVTASFTRTPNTNLIMSQPVSFIDTSTGVPLAPSSWNWNIAGGIYATADVILSSGFIDWFAIGGTSGDQPGDSITVTATLTASAGALTSTTSQNFAVSKIGTIENNYINTDGVSLSYTNDSVFSVVMNGGVPLVTSDIFYPGSDIIYELDLSSGSQNIDNFHVTTEDSTFVFTGGPDLANGGVTSSSGYIIIDESLYLSGLVPIIDGEYITPGLVNKIYFTCPSLDLLYNQADQWDVNLIETIVNSQYPLTLTAQSSISGFQFPLTVVAGNQLNPVVYSPTFITNLGYPGLSYQIRLYVVISGITSSVNVFFTANGGVGNENMGTGDFYVMQDTTGTGVATEINNAISASIPGGLNTIQAVTDRDYSILNGADSANYEGLALLIKDPNVDSVFIIDNSQSLTLSTGYPFAPFGWDVANPSPINCTGIITSTIDLSTYKDSLGTRLQYGGSIF